MGRISFGEPNNHWAKYELAERPIRFNGEESSYKAILKEDRLVAILGKGYNLLPNEEAVRVADEAAKAAGLSPFDEFKGKWYARLSDHVITDKKENQVHALYCLQDSYEVNGDKLYLGVGVHNSIDGSLGFGAGVFTFRIACANMVLAGLPRYEQQFDQRRTLEYLGKAHRKSLTEFVGGFRDVIFKVVDRAQELLSNYRELNRIQANEDLVKRLQKLPDSALPEFLRCKKPEAKIPDVSSSTVWNIYNDITKVIWHNDRQDIRTKIDHYATLHNIVLPLVSPRRVA